MANYLFISSRDPYESPDSESFIKLVESIQARHHSTTVFLVQNGVLSARSGARHSEIIQRLARAGVTVIADRFSLRERAVGKLADGVAVADIDRLVDLMIEPDTKTIWQ